MFCLDFLMVYFCTVYFCKFEPKNVKLQKKIYKWGKHVILHKKAVLQFISDRKFPGGF